MRYAKLTFALLGLAAVLVAADPSVGTWKLNNEKSEYKTGAPPKEQTLTITESGDDLDVTIEGTAADGTEFSAHYTVPAAGGEGKIIESQYDGVSYKHMSENQREISYSKGGKVVLTVRTRFSTDGKTMTATVKGTNAQGQPVDAVAVYDKE